MFWQGAENFAAQAMRLCHPHTWKNAIRWEKAYGRKECSVDVPTCNEKTAYIISNEGMHTLPGWW